MTPSPAVLLLVPALYAAGALLVRVLARPGDPARWSLALRVAALPPVLALGAAVMLGVRGPALAAAPLGLGTRLDAATVVMLLVVTTIAALILRFSRRYLDGEPGQVRYLVSYLATMAAASLLVITDHLLVLAVAWLASGITLHQLLTFHETRPAALVAAHKKFLLARLADLAIFGAVALIWRSEGTLAISRLVAQVGAGGAVSPALQVAGVLLATGVALRSAQLPFHGWLIQVMEAPTPVSALLHAGIVNIGGFVLIRLAGLVEHLDGARAILVVGGGATAVLASLVMTTRVSVKVALAWSTCAQMGFMLLECGLGAWGLALLHLAAHSLYKAHAFLSSGHAVELYVRRTMRPAPAPVAPWRALASALVAVVLVAAVASLGGLRLETEPGLAALGVILALGVAPLIARASLEAPAIGFRAAGAVVGLVLLYVGWHAAFGTLVPSAAPDAAADALRSGLAIGAFALLYAVQTWIAAHPQGRLARAIYPACFAGFYLDEIMTRLTFRLWPPRPVPTLARSLPPQRQQLAERAA